MTDQIYPLDLDELREEITRNIISLFQAIDDQATTAHAKFDEFRPITEGYSLSHDAILRVLDLETTDSTAIPIIESLEEIFDGWNEEDFSIEKAWDEIRLFIKKITG